MFVRTIFYVRTNWWIE